MCLLQVNTVWGGEAKECNNRALRADSKTFVSKLFLGIQNKIVVHIMGFGL